MKLKVAAALGAFYVLMGVAAAISPGWFLSPVDWGSRAGLLVAGGLRIVAGTVLLLAGPTSRFPKAFRVLGWIALVAGLLMPFIPLELWSEYMRMWTVDLLQPFRALMFVGATAFGAFIIYGSTTRPADAT